MAKEISKLTLSAIAGYEGQANSNIYSSPMWYAHELGIALKASGRSKPDDVRMSRGYSIRSGDMLFKIHGDKNNIGFERIK